MMTRHSCSMETGHSVTPYVRVAAGKATLLEMEYEWGGVKGTVPQVVMDLVSDPADEMVYLVGVYQNAAGERQAVVDSRAVRPGQAAAESSADSVMAAQGWDRCFVAFQTFVPPGLAGPVEEESSATQIFEFVSRSPNV
jgi:hypothetical protein